MFVKNCTCLLESLLPPLVKDSCTPLVGVCGILGNSILQELSKVFTVEWGRKSVVLYRLEYMLGR